MSNEIERRGLMLVLSSPSGAGKTTLSRRLLELEPIVTMSVSVTTRPPRQGEVEGKDYFFVSSSSFQGMAKGGGFLEHAQVFGHHYGTPKEPVMMALAKGRDVLFDIDWQGTQELTGKIKPDLVTVFILPPSIDALRKRLTTRAADSAEVIAGRMSKAASELSHFREYDYIVVNRDLDESIAKVRAILIAERQRQGRIMHLVEFVRGLQGEV
jgi:guanylate kinase